MVDDGVMGGHVGVAYKRRNKDKGCLRAPQTKVN
jgi:hypothetical protein